jgi:hypothetical protein
LFLCQKRMESVMDFYDPLKALLATALALALIVVA